MLIPLFIFIIGLCFGSFLNAFLWRYRTKKSLTGRSICPKCKKKINWYDNIPLVSYIALKGKCRQCKSAISLQYPIVELITGLVFLLVWLYSNPGKTLAATFSNIVLQSSQALIQPVLTDLLRIAVLFFVLCTLIVISTYDIKEKEIPNGFNLTFIISAIIYAFLSFYGSATFINAIFWHTVAAIAAFLFFYIFVFFSKETWMGGGDAKFALGIGFLLGPSLTFLAILLSSWLGASYGIFLIITKKATGKSEIPYGPFLVLGTMISLMFGSQIIAWYAKIFLGL